MKGSVETRITRLATAMANVKTGKLIATFADGHVEYVNGGAAVGLALDSGVIHFTASPGSGQGALPDLLNEILERI